MNGTAHFNVCEVDLSRLIKGDAAPLQLDAVVVGAGFAGLYMLFKLRTKGFSVTLLEAGHGVGGTWYWNRYPGARCDVPSMEYSYSFSPELEQEWDWSETFASQPEIERYLNHVADRFDLRRDIIFGERVTSTIFDEGSATWDIRTQSGMRLSASYCIMATGCLSVPLQPDISGLDTFGGTVVQTSRWPSGGVELDGKRVAVIGTGSSGVQLVPVIAAHAAELTVFQRSPTYTWPIKSRPFKEGEQRRIKEHYPELRRRQRHSKSGSAGGTEGAALQPRLGRLLDLSEEQRISALDQSGFAVTFMFEDVAIDTKANVAARALYAEMVRRTVGDPVTAEALTPRLHPIGCKRNVMSTGYFETFNRENVQLVDLRKESIIAAVPGGIQTSSRKVEVDIIALATGFDAITGALQRIDIRGRGSRRLRDAWVDGPRNYLGLMISGFPNLFTITGPGSPGLLTNVVVSIEQHVDWIADCLNHLRERCANTIEPIADAERIWVEHVNAIAAGTMYTAEGCNSFYLGANVPGKPRQFMPYAGGLEDYRMRCEAVAASGYEGFYID